MQNKITSIGNAERNSSNYNIYEQEMCGIRV